MSPVASHRILLHLRRIAGDHCSISYADFIDAVLYAPEIGYYTRPRLRVGRHARSDFYTAASYSPLFGDLVCSAALEIWGESLCRKAAFVEIGAEPDTSLIGDIDHPFASCRVIRLGDPLEIPPASIVFFNELLDAQPFHRLVFQGGVWRERGVSLESSGELRECLLDRWSPGLEAAAPKLPERAPEGYRLDLPTGAERLLDSIVSFPWTGGLICFDYGKSRSEMTTDAPEGTARGYYHHRMVTNLLEHSGEMDITCHVCWDSLQGILAAAGFESIAVERQEAFLVRRALPGWWQRHAGIASQERRLLQELIHPDRLGHRFQVLWGTRR